MLSSTAFELGELRVESSVNEPLEASIILSGQNVSESAPVIVDTASKIDFLRHKVKRAYYISDLNSSLEYNLAGKPIIKLTSKEPVMSQRMDLLIMMMTTKEKTLGKYQFVLPQVRTLNDPPVVAVNRLAPVAKLLASETRTKSADLDQIGGIKSTPVYYVRPGDSLSRIAMTLKEKYPDYASWHLLMMAIAKKNIGAFYNGNINHLKVGVALNLPGVPVSDKAFGDVNYAVTTDQHQDKLTDVVEPEHLDLIKPYIPRAEEKVVSSSLRVDAPKPGYITVRAIKAYQQNDRDYQPQGVFSAVLLSAADQTKS
ncbi:hypothetical protein [Candidatus Sororendozoicomonas aggregata]|uniref:type IV pilus assembly protein FimV n=1 Tax=Candidatus Sororendozoicomonas aggregata TaxID=3073239 RepID=UPI002ED231C5